MHYCIFQWFTRVVNAALYLSIMFLLFDNTQISPFHPHLIVTAPILSTQVNNPSISVSISPLLQCGSFSKPLKTKKTEYTVWGQLQ